MADKVYGYGFNNVSVGYNFTRQEELAAESAPEQGKSNAKENSGKEVSDSVYNQHANAQANVGIALLNMQNAQKTQENAAVKIEKAKEYGISHPDTIQRAEELMSGISSNYDSYISEIEKLYPDLSPEAVELIAAGMIDKDLQKI